MTGVGHGEQSAIRACAATETSGAGDKRDLPRGPIRALRSNAAEGEGRSPWSQVSAGHLVWIKVVLQLALGKRSIVLVTDAEPDKLATRLSGHTLERARRIQA